LKKLEDIIKPLLEFKQHPEWQGFFDRIHRLIDLDELIGSETSIDWRNSSLTREATRKTKWLLQFRNDYMLRIKRLDQFEAMVELYENLLNHERFQLISNEYPE